MTPKGEEGSYLFGIHPVLERLREPSQQVVEILLAKGPRGKALRSVEEEAKRRGVVVGYVEANALTLLVGVKKHQGVVARVPATAYSDFTDLLSRLSHAQGHSWILALDGVTDPQNFGSLMRTAEGMGIRDMLIPKDRSAGMTPTVVKASAGAAFYVKVYRVTNLRRALHSLKERDHWIVGLDAEAGEEIGRRVYPEKLVIVLGSEGTGMRPLIRAECDYLVAIPMSGKILSFNVAVSGGMFLYELMRQKKTAQND